MSFLACIDKALTAKRIKGAKADEARAEYRRQYDKNIREGLPEQQAQDMAAERATATLELEKAERAKRQIAHVQRAVKIDKAFREGGVRRLASRIRGLAERDTTVAENVGHPDLIPYQSYVDRNLGLLLRSLAGFIIKYEPKIIGLHRPKAGLDNVAREAFGQATGDGAAREFAKGWLDAKNLAIRMFNYAGGSLRHLEGWAMPQKMSRARLVKMGEDDFVRHHTNGAMRVDWEKTRWPDGTRIEPDQREGFLREYYKTRKTGGDIRILKLASEYADASGGRLPKGQGAFVGRSAVGNQFDIHRVMHYADGDAWLAMHKALGDGSVFDVMMADLKNMSHQIAMVQSFGPNPTAMRHQIELMAKRVAAEHDAVKGAKPVGPNIEKAIATFGDMFDVISRAAKAPDASRSASGMAALRNLITAAFLGSSSWLSILGDQVTTVITKRFNKTPGMKTFSRYLKMMNPLDPHDRMLAIQSSILAENATNAAYAQTRYLGFDSLGPAITRRISDTVLRATLMSPHTEAIRMAFPQEFMGMLARMRGQAFDELPFKAMLDRYRITAADWDALRAIQPHNDRGAEFLRPDDMLERSGLSEKDALAIADKWMAMILDEARYFAVPNAQLRAVVSVRGATRPGTIAGELMRSAGMFKNFPITIGLTHMARGLTKNTVGGKMTYLAALIGGLTLVGAINLQMREISHGRDPRNMLDVKFWAQAALVGGGLSIWGDFLFSNVNRFGAGLAETAAGPVLQSLTDVQNLTIGNLVKVLGGEDTTLRKDLIKFAARYNPTSSIIYARLLLNNLIWEQLLQATDPAEAKRLRSEVTRRRRRTGQEYWWRPGETGPRRGPDLSKMVQ